MTETEFQNLAQQGYNRIPCIFETLADLDTPLSVNLKLAKQPYSYLLESVEGGERFGRYSFIGLACPTRIAAYGQETLVLTGDRLVEKSPEGVNPLDFINNYLKRYKVPAIAGLPRFAGGLVGCFGYETIGYIEPKLAQSRHKDVLGLPDICLLLSEELAIVDNLSGKLSLVIYADPAVPGAYQKAQQRIETLVNQLKFPLEVPQTPIVASGEPELEMSQDAFENAVKRAKDYIYEGDIMQVVLSQRLSQPFDASPLALYRALRAINPSPYMYYYHFDDFHVVGTSPEILVRLEGETVTVRPIAGTRRRAASLEEDDLLAQEMLNDPKERAEHTMLLDLGRNDVGRVAKPATVAVTDKMIVERYSHVMHMVSNVQGQLNDVEDAMSVFKATFPAGTVSGAPKIRAMEIIDELEPSKRGLYAGAIGYIGFHGDMDLAITIRTAIIKHQKIYVQAGAGIVADSNPTTEWHETLNKAKVLLKAADMAVNGLKG